MPVVSNTPAPAQINTQANNPYAKLFQMIWVIFGGPKVGKTTVAATLGRKDGKNLIWLMYDNGGINTIIAETDYNVVHYLDVPRLRLEKNLTVPMATKEVEKFLKSVIATNPNEDWRFVVDGLTQLNGWIAIECPKDSSGKPEWTRFQTYFGEFSDVILKFQRPVVFVMHAALDTGDVRDPSKTQDAKLVTGAQSGEVIKPAITGAGVRYFTNAADYICFLEKTTNPKGETIHTLHIDGGDKAQGGLRFASYLPSKVVNANLSELMETVQEGIAKKKGMTVEQLKSFGS